MLVVTASSAALLVAAPPLVAQQPTKVTTIVEEAPMAAASLAQMWRGAPVVVRVKVVTQGPPERDPRVPSPFIIRHHRASILEVLKRPASIGDAITIVQSGGSLVINGVEYETANSLEALLTEGETAVAFLYADGDGYRSIYGGGGFLPVDDVTGTVKVPAKASQVADFAGKSTVPADAVLRVLRALRDQTSPARR